MSSKIKAKIDRLNESRHQLREKVKANPVLFFLFRGAIISLGIFVIILGLIMCVTPGPGALGIFAGLAILSTEIPWAKIVVRRIILIFRRLKVRVWDKKIAPRIPKRVALQNDGS
jgi:uncharacterized protein (TIGR02611 family)